MVFVSSRSRLSPALLPGVGASTHRHGGAREDSGAWNDSSGWGILVFATTRASVDQAVPSPEARGGGGTL